jgi:hypothetical protein
MNTLHLVVIFSTQVFVCIVAMIGFLKYKKLILPLKILQWYIICSIVNDLLLDVLVFSKFRTLWLWQCFAVLELLFFVRILNSWNSSRRYTRLIWTAYGMYIAVWIIGKFSFEPFTSSDTYSQTISQAIQIGFGSWILLFRSQDNQSNWKKDPRLWVASGIVLYAASTFFIFGMFEVLWASSHQAVRGLWMLNNFFMVIQYVLFLRALLCNPVFIVQDTVPASTSK